ncbi:MAG: CoA transferase [Erysipelotrichaceae bacterium]|nr:CoA transferase [Erysipelotrichaceae bacterium]
MEENRDALKDITVLDLTRVVAGPYCGAMLGDLGANVIKIEIPGKGDDGRGYGPYINGESLYYGNLNRDKKGITLNLKTEKGKEIFKQLVKKADVVIENYRPGVMERLGLGYDTLKEINDQLVYGSISGFGTYGPYASRPGYDIISQAMGGLMAITGQPDDPPTRVGSAIGDILGGTNLVIAILAALHARNLYGHGQRVEVALIDSVVAGIEQTIQRYVVSGKNPARRGNNYASIAPYDSYEASDGYLVIGCGNQKLYEILCHKILQRPDLLEDERFLTVPLRVKNQKEMKEIIEGWTKQRTVKEAVDQVLSVGIPAGPINSVSDIVNDEHIAKVREMIVEVDHPVMGKVKLNGTPIKMDESRPHIHMPSPTLGQHNEEILGGLGYSLDEIASLKEEGVI